MFEGSRAFVQPIGSWGISSQLRLIRVRSDVDVGFSEAEHPIDTNDVLLLFS